nr:GNAT family protein [Sphingomonas insulae]
MPTLATARLRLRRRVPDDAGALFATMADAGAMRWWSCAPFDSVDAVRQHFGDGTFGGRAWAVTRSDDDTAIGFVVANAHRQAGVVEIGYLIARDAWGAGVAREAVSAVVAHLFASGTRRVFADSDPDNAGSIRLLRAMGFTLEGRLRAEWETHIGVRDALIFGLLRDEWRG